MLSNPIFQFLPLSIPLLLDVGTPYSPSLLEGEFLILLPLEGGPPISPLP